MISKAEFIRRVQAEAFPKLLGTERKRRWTLFKFLIFLFVSLLLVVYVCLHPTVLNTKDGLEGFLILILIPLLIAEYIWRNFVRKQKKTFLPLFLNFLGDLENRQIDIDKNLLRHTCLFYRFDGITYDDCFSGTFKNTRFSVAEIMLWIQGKHKNTTFRGVCIDIPMKTPISGYILLYNTRIPKHPAILEKVSLEDSSFCKKYQIFSDSQVEARVLLTPAFIERLNHLKRCFKNKRIDVAFFGNHAVFVIRTWKNSFESYSLFRSVKSLKTYQNFYDEIKAIHDMIDVLSINNKSLSIGTFNGKLYRKISSKNENRSELLLFVSIMLFSTLVPILLAIIGSLIGTVFVGFLLFVAVIVYFGFIIMLDTSS